MNHIYSHIVALSCLCVAGIWTFALIKESGDSRARTQATLVDQQNIVVESEAALIEEPVAQPNETSPTPIQMIISPTDIAYAPTETPVPTAPPIPSPSSFTSSINAYRSSKGLNPLLERADLCVQAQNRANETNGNFNHDGFNNNVANGTYQSLNYSQIAENLWQGQPFSIESLMSDWQASSRHNDNMLGNWSYGCGAQSGQTAAFLFLR